MQIRVKPIEEQKVEWWDFQEIMKLDRSDFNKIHTVEHTNSKYNGIKTDNAYVHIPKQACEVIHEWKVGDWARVIDDGSGVFKVGDIVRITSIGNYGLLYARSSREPAAILSNRIVPYEYTPEKILSGEKPDASKYYYFSHDGENWTENPSQVTMFNKSRKHSKYYAIYYGDWYKYIKEAE